MRKYIAIITLIFFISLAAYASPPMQPGTWYGTYNSMSLGLGTPPCTHIGTPDAHFEQKSASIDETGQVTYNGILRANGFQSADGPNFSAGVHATIQINNSGNVSVYYTMTQTGFYGSGSYGSGHYSDNPPTLNFSVNTPSNYCKVSFSNLIYHY